MYIGVSAPTSKSQGMQMLQSQEQEHKQRSQSQRGSDSKLGSPKLAGLGPGLEDK